MSGPWVFIMLPFITSPPPVWEVGVVSSRFSFLPLPRTACWSFFNLRFGTGPSFLCPAMVLKVEVAHPVDDVKQQEGGGEKDARVRVQLQ